jgi:hypothetical protein
MDNHYFQDVLRPIIGAQDEKHAVDFLSSQALLSLDMKCETCKHPMKLVARSKVCDGLSWRCYTKTCSSSWTTIRKHSFFERSRVKLSTWIHVLWLWAIETSVRNTILMTGLSKVTVVDMFSFCREVCSVHLDTHPVELGGHGVVCSIDESCFSHKQKYQRGRAPEREIWVLALSIRLSGQQEHT